MHTTQLVYMLGAKHGFAQSMDCATQTVDPYLRDNPWIARAINGSRVSKDAKYRFMDNHGLCCVRKQLVLHKSMLCA